MEDLGREVSHVAVEENKQGLDDSGVRGETGSEGAKEAVDGSHQDASQRDHKETDHTEEGVDHSHSPGVGKLLEEVIQNLRREKHMSGLSLPVLGFIQSKMAGLCDFVGEVMFFVCLLTGHGDQDANPGLFWRFW